MNRIEKHGHQNDRFKRHYRSYEHLFTICFSIVSLSRVQVLKLYQISASNETDLWILTIYRYTRSHYIKHNRNAQILIVCILFTWFIYLLRTSVSLSTLFR